MAKSTLSLIITESEMTDSRLVETDKSDDG